MATEYWESRLAKAKAMLDQVEATLETYSDSVQSVSMDTGQTRVAKSKFELASLTKQRDSLLNEISVLEVRCGQGGTFYGRPL